MIKKSEAEDLAKELSDIDEEIEKLEKDLEKEESEKSNKKDELEKKKKEIQDRVKERTKKSKENTKNKIDSKKKKLKIDVKDVEDDNTDRTEKKVTTRSASREIVSLFNAMTQRKEFVNRVRSIDVELEKDGRNSLMVVDGIPFMKLNMDGNGRLTLRLETSDNSRKVFRFVILPLLKVLNEFFGGEITISNKKNANKSLSFNSEKTVYVSSGQVKNKPVKAGQTIYFTNLKHGKFTVK
jgi:DNA gyrase/topoisomerase IV subunit A